MTIKLICFNHDQRKYLISFFNINFHGNILCIECTSNQDMFRIAVLTEHQFELYNNINITSIAGTCKLNTVCISRKDDSKK